jgi:hypothetical protein
MSAEMRDPSKEEIRLIPAVLYSQKSKKEMKDQGIVVGEYIKKKDGKSLWLDFPWNLFIKGADA